MKGDAHTPGVKLTAPQYEILAWYAERAPTTAVFGRIATWRALVRRGMLTTSRGAWFVETDITPKGRAALAERREP